MVNWAKGLDALGAGLLRQADIGGRAYEGAMTKEAEARAESRLISAERRALAAALAKERRDNIEWERREGITSDTAKDAAAALQKGKETITGMGTASSEKIAAAGQAGASDRQKKLIAADVDAAKLLADERAALVKKRRTWAIEDAKRQATSDQAIKRIEATVSRAKEAEDALAKLYEGLKDAGVVWDEKTQTYTSGSDYMDMIHRAQKRVEAAWRATGIKPLMADRNINATKWGYLEHSIFGAISLDLKENKPDVWKDIVEGLQSDKTSSDYKKAVETITPYLNDALKMSSMRITTSEKDSIREALIERLSRFEEEDFGNGNTGETGAEDTPVLTPSLLSSIFGGDPLANIAPDITEEDIGTVKKAQAALDALPTTARGGRPSGLKSQQQKDLEKAKKRDPEYLLIPLKEEKKRIKEQLALPMYNPPRVQERLDKINELINRFSSMLENSQASTLPSENPQASALPPASNTSLPPGMLNTGGGMIAAVDQGISPQEFAYWEPDVADARAKAMQRPS